MLLADVSGIRESLGFDDMPDINAAIQTSLDAVEAQLASLFETDFAKGTVTDTFFVPRPEIEDQAFRFTSFRTSQGFLTAPPTVISTLKGGWHRLIDNDGPTDVSANVVCDLEKGLIRDWTTCYRVSQVTMTYSYGFEVDPNNPDSYLLSQVPNWLQNAARLLSLVNLANDPVITEANIKIDTKTIGSQYALLVNKHLRYGPNAVLPL